MESVVAVADGVSAPPLDPLVDGVLTSVTVTPTILAPETPVTVPQIMPGVCASADVAPIAKRAARLRLTRWTDMRFILRLAPSAVKREVRPCPERSLAFIGRAAARAVRRGFVPQAARLPRISETIHADPVANCHPWQPGA